METSDAPCYLKAFLSEKVFFSFSALKLLFYTPFPTNNIGKRPTLCRISFWTELYSRGTLLSRNINIRNELSHFQPEISYFTLFFSLITSQQGLTQCRISFWTKLVTRGTLLSWNINIWNELFHFQPEISYFTLFFSPITSQQGLTQCRISFWTKLYSRGTFLSWSILVTAS